MSRLGAIAGVLLVAVLVASPASVAFGAPTYSFDDTATVVVLHPDSLESVGVLVAESMPASDTAGAVVLDGEALALLRAGYAFQVLSLLTLCCMCAYLVSRGR